MTLLRSTLTQSKMKKWYDLKALQRVFKSGNRVLMLLPGDLIGQVEYVSKFDLLKGYWQLETTFVTPYDLYRYTVMPFRMKNALATFQWMINRVVSGLNGCQAYIEDAIVKQL